MGSRGLAIPLGGCVDLGTFSFRWGEELEIWEDVEAGKGKFKLHERQKVGKGAGKSSLFGSFKGCPDVRRSPGCVGDDPHLLRDQESLAITS